MTTASRQKNDTDIISQFTKLAEEYAAFAQRSGITVSPYRSADTPLFCALDSTAQQNVISDMHFVLGVFKAVESDGYTLKDSPKLLWRALKSLRLTPCPDIFDKIGESDMV